MKNVLKKFCAFIFTLLFVVLMSVSAFAHSGRTDGSGGHKDNKNASGLGSYHYHCGGYSAHLHTYGYCPYFDVFPSGVKISTEKTTLGIGERVTLNASVYPSNACDTDVTWESSDETVVDVDDGEIVAKKYGTATIYAETFNEKKGSITITVKEITAETVTVSGLPEKEHHYIGDTFILTAVISPENVDNPTLIWSSSDETLATVSETGQVSLLSAGSVEIRATASNGVVGKAVVNVEEKYVESVDITDEQKEMLLFEEYELKATIEPSDATDPSLVWTVSDPAVVTVTENGKITAVACGEAIVTATATSGVSDNVLVRINEIKAESIEIEGPASIHIGAEVVLTQTIRPADTTVQIVEWSVDDETVASISEDGLLTAKGVGKVTVTAKQKDVLDTLQIEVLPINVESIVITMDTEDSISKGDTVTFFAEVYPKNATYPEITWTVSDSSVATIDENGVLTALKGGSITIVATAGDGFFAEYEIFITSPVYTVLSVGSFLAVVGVVVVKKKKK